jgi:DNA-binding MarR family transcriptional regulator
MDDSINDILLKVGHAHFLKIYSYVEKIGIHPGQGKVLLILRDLNGINQREICKKLNVKPSTVTVMIKRMEKNNYIERKSDECDQRITRIFITQKGLEVCKLLDEAHKNIEKDCFKNFTDEEIVLTKKLLTKVKDNLNNCDI